MELDIGDFGNGLVSFDIWMDWDMGKVRSKYLLGLWIDFDKLDRPKYWEITDSIYNC